MEKVSVGPGQPLAIGVTVMFAITLAVPTLIAVKAAMLPVPLAASPIAGLSFVQSYVVPEPEKLIAAVVAPLHKTWSVTVFTAGVELTMMFTLPDAELEQEFASVTPVIT